jgi:hypothetical protein
MSCFVQFNSISLKGETQIVMKTLHGKIRKPKPRPFAKINFRKIEILHIINKYYMMRHKLFVQFTAIQFESQIVF